MNKLYIITGPAGVGKSTVSKMVASSLEKSVLIEGDDVYNQFVGGRIPPWKDGAPLDLFWNNCTGLIENYLSNGYDVVFNYIIMRKNFELLKKKFKNYEVKFIVLLVDEKTVIERDKQRPLDCQMGERSLVLLHGFINENYDKNYILDSSDLSINDTVDKIMNEDRFLVKKINIDEIKEINSNVSIIEYSDRYLEDVKDLLVELEEYIITIDKDNLDTLHQEYREKMATLDLEEVNRYDGKCYLAIENDKAIGLIMGCIPPYDEFDYLDYKCPRRGEITELIVTSNTRNSGIGNMLINKMEDYFKEKKCEWVIVDVFGYNEKGYNFYVKNNYHTRMKAMIKKLKE